MRLPTEYLSRIVEQSTRPPTFAQMGNGQLEPGIRSSLRVVASCLELRLHFIAATQPCGSFAESAQVSLVTIILVVIIATMPIVKKPWSYIECRC